MWWVFIFLHFVELHTWNLGFPFCFWLATKALCVGNPGAGKREETNGVSLGNKCPTAFLQEFQGFGTCCGFTSSPCLHYISFWIKWHLSNHHRSCPTWILLLLPLLLVSFLDGYDPLTGLQGRQLLSLIWKARGEEREKESLLILCRFRLEEPTCPS